MGIEERQVIVETDRQRRQVGVVMSLYLMDVLADDHPDFQVCPFAVRPWRAVLMDFDSSIEKRVRLAQTNPEKLPAIISTLVTRGVEMVSGGISSSREISDGARRGLSQGGTWPDVPDGHFWHPNERRRERARIDKIIPRILALETNASEGHVGRIITMSLPAIFSWSDLGNDLISDDEIVVTVKRMLDAESIGKFITYTFGCEPYEYEFKENSTTTHFRRSRFGNEETIRIDAIRGSFRAVRRILEPLTLSGINTEYHFFTSFGSSWELIQRQVMPDTLNYYRFGETPDAMLVHLRWWREILEQAGKDEFSGSSLELKMREMEQEVVFPALVELGRVLETCGMELPQDKNEFYMKSEAWFHENMQNFGLLAFVHLHPHSMLLLDFLKNEDEWSRLHPESYTSDRERMTLATLLSFFEYHQYERIHQYIEECDLALGVEIDEELIRTIRRNMVSQQRESTPLLWGRPPRFTKDGHVGGVAHRQPWFYATK